MKTNTKFILIACFLVILLLGTVTYGFFNYTRIGAANTIRVGKVSFVSSQRNTINLGNVFPITSGEAPSDDDNSSEVTITITGDATQMSGMFAECPNLTVLDLSSFNTGSLSNCSGMFASCEDLVTIYVGSNWDISSVGNSASMFMECESIIGGQDTRYDENFTDKSYGHVDGGPSNKGYLTLKIV